MPLRNLTYRRKIQVLFAPLFALMTVGLLLVYNIAAHSIAAEHRERLRRTEQLTDVALKSTVTEMRKMADLFQTNRTLKKYLYRAAVAEGDRAPIAGLLKPAAVSLGIDDLELYDRKGRRLVAMDTRPGAEPKEDRIANITGALPVQAVYGFTDTAGMLKIDAVTPLTQAGRIVGYISVGKYLDRGYFAKLKEISGNELFRVDLRNRIISGAGAKTSFYAPRNGKLTIGDLTYSVIERNLAGIDGKPLGVLVIALSDHDLLSATTRLKRYMLGLLFTGALLSFIISRLFMRTLVDPLNRITASTGRVAQGKLDEELLMTGKDEIAVLAEHFNDMQRRLKEQREVVKKYTDDLERAVEERTDELKKVQRQLFQSQKMEAVGQLAGGIAHDFNNYLTAIIGYAGIYQKKLPADDPLRVYADQILAASKRAAELTRGLLTFSRQQNINPMPVDLNEIIKDTEQVLLRLIGEDIDLKTVLSDRPFTIMADSGQLGQVLMNLATNARDAMPEGGCLIIETRTIALDQAFVRQNGYGRPGTYALLTVTDTGAGMEEAVKEKMFDPFFTTKEPGKGTGLGLSMVYGTVKQHEGFINVYSEPGAGTAVNIYLPLIGPAADARRVEELSAPPAGGRETVLLAEDDELVRELTVSWLEEAGYTVIPSIDGEDALAKFEEHKDRVRLLILDVVMPKKNGKDVYEAVQKSRPGVKVLFASGYTADIVLRKGIVQQGFRLILKPFTQNDMLKKVREVLDERTDPGPAFS